MTTSKEEEVIKEGLVVTLGQNLFSLPKLRWFSLRKSGLYFSAEAPEKLVAKSHQPPKNLIEFDTMFVRVEKIDGIDSKFDEKVDVYCLRVGDKRKCRTLCFISWEERDFWVIAILHSIAQFKMTDQSETRSAVGKIRYNVSSASLRARPTGVDTQMKHAPLRHTRSECDRETRSKSVGLRKRFSSLRSRKSIREGEYGNEIPTLRLKGLKETTCSARLTSNRARFRSQSEEKSLPLDFEESTPEDESSPQSPRWFEKLSPSSDMRRHFSSFMTKFT